MMTRLGLVVGVALAAIAAPSIAQQRPDQVQARQMFEKGKRTTRLELLFHPPIAFVRNYILKGGFRDGKPGLIISLVNSYYVMLKFAKLWELQRD